MYNLFYISQQFTFFLWINFERSMLGQLDCQLSLKEYQKYQIHCLHRLINKKIKFKSLFIKSVLELIYMCHVSSGFLRKESNIQCIMLIQHLVRIKWNFFKKFEFFLNSYQLVFHIIELHMVESASRIQNQQQYLFIKNYLTWILIYIFCKFEYLQQMLQIEFDTE